MKQYLNQIYSGFLGMNIGIRLGAPVEPSMWTYERIERTYGDIRGYVKDYVNFAADDDANGPVFFLRALIDDAKDRDITPQDVAKAWLNYAREGVGMFWWGGYGRSTEHTAYLNLKNGIPAPRSGSIAQNGATIAQQIGGQIFIDTWGLALPNQPTRAADFGQAAASVSHDGEGLWGARFMCAAISAAFEAPNIQAVLAAALAEIPADSEYARVVRAVMDFHRAHPDSFRDCYQMLRSDFGYDRYPGVCHIIPNAGVCALALCYGNGDFSRTVEIATMCGWDTDCNAGNVGTILGVLCGPDGLPAHYRAPINDGIVLSGISGYLNILDIPTYAREVAALAARLNGQAPDAPAATERKNGEIHFDFELPGSTHNIRVSDSFFVKASHSTRFAAKGSGSLEILIDRLPRRDEGVRVFYKPYYSRADFSDERYSPVFSPTVYSGQTVAYDLYWENLSAMRPPLVAPYIRLANSKQYIIGADVRMTPNQWRRFCHVVPDSQGEPIDEIGLMLTNTEKDNSLSCLYLDEVAVTGPAAYRIEMAKQVKNFGCLSPFSQNKGAWELENGSLTAMSCDEFAQAFTGNYYAANYRYSQTVTPLSGEGHMLSIRAQGAMRGYYLGFRRPGFLTAVVQDFGMRVVKEVPFDWRCGQIYCFTLEANGPEISLSVNEQALLSFTDDRFAYGMFGPVRCGVGRTAYGDVAYQDLR